LGGTKSNDKLLRKDLFNLNNTLKLKSEGDEKDTSYKWKTKESRGSDNYIRQNRFKKYKTRQRNTFCNDKCINSSKEYNNYKYICT
jgi:hypothetical protein